MLGIRFLRQLDRRMLAPDRGRAASSEPVLAPLTVEDAGEERVLSGTWLLDAGAQLSMQGTGALVRVTYGVVTIVNHEGELIYDTEPGDDDDLRKPPGEALVVNAQDDTPVYLFLDEMTGRVWVGAGEADSAAVVAIEVLGSADAGTICSFDDVTCWGWGDALPVPAGYVGGVTCARVRCWTK